MSKTAMFISAFATTTLLIGNLSGLSVQLTFVGILVIMLCAAVTPTGLPGSYVEFDGYYPTQAPFRDYVLAFGLASLGLVALFPKFCSSLWSLAGGQPTLEVRDTGADRNSFLTPRTPSPSHTFTGQWTATALTLAAGSSTLVAPRATGHCEVTDPYEVIALELRVSQLEIAMEELRYCIDYLTMEGESTLVA